MFDLAESYSKSGKQIINDVFKAPEIFSDLYNYTSCVLQLKKVSDLNKVPLSTLISLTRKNAESEITQEQINSALEYSNKIKKLDDEISSLNKKIKDNQKVANFLENGENPHQAYFYKCIDNAVNGNYIPNVKLNVKSDQIDFVTDNIYISMLEEAFKPFY